PRIKSPRDGQRILKTDDMLVASRAKRQRAKGRPGRVIGARGAFPVPAFGEEPSRLSFQLDLAFDLVRQADAGERDRARGRESLVALELALRQGLADGLLDLALRAHPQPFEKFADAAVEDVFVHDRLLCGAYCMWGQSKKPNPEDDEATVAPAISVMNSRRFTARSSRASDWKDSTETAASIPR